MKLICRALNIRKHKSVVFVDAYTNKGLIEQLMFDKDIFEKTKMKSGDCFSVSGETVKNKNGYQVFKAQKLLWLNPCISWDRVNTTQMTGSGYEKYAQTNARNGGSQIAIYKLKKELITQISAILEKDGFESAKCNILEKKRTASAIPPFQTATKMTNDPLYLRITPENQLKQISAILLNSVYTIDNVFYNKNPDAKHQPEMCTLEFIGLEYTQQKLLRFITKVSRLMSNLNKKYGFENTHSEIQEIVNYNDLDKLGIKYQRRIPEFHNTILINAPVDNLFVKNTAQGCRTETKWYMNGSLIGHGYSDEVDYFKIKKNLQQQKESNDVQDVNEMSYFKWGLPKSMSFGLGIDTLIYRHLNLSHMSLVCNPFGLNYENSRDNMPLSVNNKKGRDL